MPKYTSYLESKGHSKQAIAIQYRNLLYFLGWCEDNNIEPEETTYNELLSYIKHLQQKPAKNETGKLKMRTVQLYITSLKHYFNWLVKRKLRKDNPTRNINLKGIRRNTLHLVVRMAELEKLYDGYPVPDEYDKNKNQNWFALSMLTQKRNKVILGMMIWQGLPTTDLSRLSVKDVQVKKGQIQIPPTKRSNGRTLKLQAQQILDLMEYVMKVRKELLKINGKKTDLLFISAGTSDRFNNTMNKLMQKVRKLNPEVKSAKQIRASVITHWLKNYNLREVQYRAGHRYVSSTENYKINDLEDLQEDISKFHPIA